MDVTEFEIVINLAEGVQKKIPLNRLCVGIRHPEGLLLPVDYKDARTLSLPKIGQLFGGRDHTTVMHADRKIRQLKFIFDKRIAALHFHTGDLESELLRPA